MGIFLKIEHTFDLDRIEIFENVVVFFDRKLPFALAVQGIALLLLSLLGLI